jgi:hypothetical protein
VWDADPWPILFILFQEGVLMNADGLFRRGDEHIYSDMERTDFMIELMKIGKREAMPWHGRKR